MSASLRSESSPHNLRFSRDDVQAFIQRNAQTLRMSGAEDLADSLEAIDLKSLIEDPELLEQRLNAIEEKMIERIFARITPRELGEARRTVAPELEPYRHRMSIDQILILEKQLLNRYLIAASGLPRLSLFYFENLACEK